ncbi:MAG: CPBP family glutamic-type intramembrane protease [Candidatus Sumerlaeaceae bacterium]|nr:CPBP family glutamic-type intramembrane protease [Candidatus Sumerlaeaceae bacterium]
MSLRRAAFSAAEVIGVSTAIAVLFWVLNPRMLQPGMPPIVVAVGVLLGVYVIWLSPCWIHGDSLADRGLGSRDTLFVRTDNFWCAAGVFAPLSAVLACLLVLVGLLRNPSSFGEINWYRFLIKHGLYLVWAVVQSLFFFGFFMQRLTAITAVALKSLSWGFDGLRCSVVLLTAGLFSVAHAPNLLMMVLTFLAGILWGWHFWAQRNLLVLAASHAFLGTIIHQVLMLNMRVGPAYWEPHRFYANRVLFPFISHWMGSPQYH